MNSREDHEPEKLLRSYIDRLDRVAATAVAKSTAVPKDLRKRIADHTKEVLRVVKASPDASPITLRRLTDLLRAAFWLGAKAYEIGIVDRQKRQSTAPATAARRKASELKRDIVARHARPILKKHPKHTSNRIAVAITDAVSSELSAVGLPPLKADAIRRILKRWRTDERSSS